MADVWVRINWAVNEDCQHFTERRYARLLVSNVWVDRLFTACGYVPTVTSGFLVGITLFEALLAVGSDGTWAEGRILAWGYDLPTAQWVIVVYHPTFAQIADGATLPEMPLLFDEEDLQQITQRVREVV